MLNHSENLITSSPPNEWPQKIDETRLMASSGRVMEKPEQLEQALKCPRCDSSNTKFCYYNNYSLSQPRHFCKACKRYWTRGGSLRNVPVGGGYRKNKRVKRSSPNDASPSPSSSSSSAALTTPTPTLPPVSAASTHINPLFYGLPSMGSSTYDLLPQLNALGLGFMNSEAHEDEYRIGFNPSCQIQNVSSYSPSAAYLIASSLHQQQKIMQLSGLKDNKPGNHQFHPALLPVEELQMGLSSDMGTVMKEVKLEERENNRRIPFQNPIDPVGSADPSLYWNTTNFGTWADLNNFGSSVTPLI